MKKDYGYTIVYPIKQYYEDTPIEEMDKIYVTLEICTLYKGLPHGIAIITYTHPEYEHRSFRGVGVFVHGQLHNAPFTCLQGNGWGRSFSKMQNGRPAQGSYETYFYREGYTQHVDSLEERTHVGGWSRWSIQVGKERRHNG
jgi:hypothetical protein